MSELSLQELMEKRWYKGVPMPENRYNHSSAIVGGKVYCYGGKVSNIICYDPLEQRWQEVVKTLPGQLMGASHYQCFAYGDLLYCYSTTNKSVTYWATFNTESKAWSNVSQLTSPTGILINFKVIGTRAYCLNTTTHNLHYYDLEKGTWNSGYSMPRTRGFADMALIGTKLYIIGGSNILDIFDIETEEWSQGQNLLYSAPTYSKCCAVGNKLFVMEYSTARCDAYDMETNHWERLNNMLTAGHSYTLEVLGGVIYRIGGTGTGITASNNVSTFPLYAVHTLECRHESDEGAVVKGADYYAVRDGESLTLRVEQLANYACLGYREEDGELVPGNTIALSDVRADRSVTFVYRKLSDLRGAYVLEKYRTAEGVVVLADTATLLEIGGDYEKNAPRVHGYNRVGSILDDDEAAETYSIRLTNVREGHEVVFLYEECEGNGCTDPDENQWTVTERYLHTDGSPLRSDTYTLVEDGDAYQKAAPTLDGYRPAGHRIDGGEQQSGSTAVLSDVRSNHTVAFLYEEDDSGSNIPYVVTERYLDAQGGALLSDTRTTVPAGDSYRKTAPDITDYRVVGYRIDGAAQQSGSVAAIANVLTDHIVTFVYQWAGGGGGETSYTVTERYLDAQGGALLSDTRTTVPAGDSYRKTAPDITDYRVVGYRIDGAAQQNGSVAAIANVLTDHIVTFVYQWAGGGGGETSYTVTERYLDAQGGALLSDTRTTVPAGDSYRKTAPDITDYRVVGYRIDGAAQQSGSIAAIANVLTDHVVLFLYEKEGGTGGGGHEGGDNGGGGGCCCGGCKPYIHIPLCYCNDKLARKVLEAVKGDCCC